MIIVIDFWKPFKIGVFNIFRFFRPKKMEQAVEDIENKVSI